MSWLEAGSGTVVISFSGDDGDGVINFDDDALDDGPAFEDMQPMLKALRDAGSDKDCAAALADVNRFAALDLIDSPHWVLLLQALEAAVKSFATTDSSLGDSLLELLNKVFAAAVEGPLQQAAEVASLTCDCSHLVYWCNRGVLWLRASHSMLARLSRCGGMLVHVHMHTRDHLLLHILRALIPSGGPCFAYRSAGAALGWLPQPDINWDDESIDHAALAAAEQAAGTVVDSRTAVGASLHDPFAEDGPFAWLNGWFIRGPWRRQLCRWMEATRAIPLLLCCVLQPTPPPTSGAAGADAAGDGAAADAAPPPPLPLLKLEGNRFMPPLDVRWAQSRHVLQLVASFADSRAMLARELAALGVLQVAPAPAVAAVSGSPASSAQLTPTLLPAAALFDTCKAAMKDLHYHTLKTFMPDVLPADDDGDVGTSTATTAATGVPKIAAAVPAVADGEVPLSLDTLQRLTLNNTLRLLCGLPVEAASEDEDGGASAATAVAASADAGAAASGSDDLAQVTSSAFGSLRSKWVQPPTVQFFPCMHAPTGTTAVSLCTPAVPIASAFLALASCSSDGAASTAVNRFPPLLVPTHMLREEAGAAALDATGAAHDDVCADVLVAWLAAL